MKAKMYGSVLKQLNQLMRISLLERESSFGFLILHSGGPDSQFLLESLLTITDSPKWIFHKPMYHILHFHHGLRKEADNDYEFVKEMAARRNLPLTALFAFPRPPWRHHIQAQASRWRRKLTLRVRQQLEISTKSRWVVLTGHHQDDHLETVLMNFIRGSGVNGLKGLRAISDDHLWWKPLLSVNKSHILDCCQRNGILFRKDQSNDSIHYSRNWLRHEIIPKLKEKNPNLSSVVFRMSENIVRVIEKSVPPEVLAPQPISTLSTESLYEIIYDQFPELHRMVHYNHLQNAITQIRHFERNKRKHHVQDVFRFPFAKNWDCIWNGTRVHFEERIK